MPSHRSVVAATATAVALSALGAIPPATSATADQDPVTAYEHAAGVPLTVHRDSRGHVDFVGSRTHGAQPLGHATDPAAAARTQLGRVGKALGTSSRDLRAGATTASVGGGTVTRFNQYVAGLPVLGGEVVLGLDKSRGLSSATAEVSTATGVARARVSEASAAKAAKAVVAREHKHTPLTVTSQGTWLYDDQLLEGPTIGQAPVYRFEVGNGTDVREQVLILAATGGVLMHADEIEGIDRRVCDADNTQTTVDYDTYADPACTAADAVRTEGAGPSGNDQVDKLYDAIGATSDLYASLGVDLTDLLGQDDGSGTKTLAATARYCQPNLVYQGVTFPSECPMANAYWGGQQFYAGDGMVADDVIGHELTHGVIQHNADLFYWGQSGAINESLADTMGEIIDHREGTDDDSAWNMGEDVSLPGGEVGPFRSASNPTKYGQPDKMTSPYWYAELPYDTADTSDTSIYGDEGGVHENSGVGNKTAYLISHGGTFNGVTVTGIDGSDKALTKTATLYMYVIQHLASGAEYADLATVLTSGCSYLVSSGTAGFTATDCTSVANAIKATELTKAPAVANAAKPAAVPSYCPTGGGSATGLTLTTDESAHSDDLWYASPDAADGIPANARDTNGSVFGYDPDPEDYGDPYNSTLSSNTFTVPAGGKRTYVYFAQWYLFDWAQPGVDGNTARYYDGGELRAVVNGVSTVIPASAWTNGPKQTLDLQGNPSGSLTGFGGDSHGWVTARADLSSYAGKTVQLQWITRGDDFGSFVGWFIDQAKLYTCTPQALPNTVRPTISGTRAIGKTLTASKGTWKPAATSWSYQWYRAGSAISGATKSTYVPTVADHGKTLTVRVTASSTAWPGGTSGSAMSYSTAAIALGTITTVKPVISGTRQVGHTLTASYSGWKPTGVRHTFRWYRNGVAIAGATSSRYKLTRADHGKRLTVHVTGALSGYKTVTVYSAATAAIRY